MDNNRIDEVLLRLNERLDSIEHDFMVKPSCLGVRVPNHRYSGVSFIDVLRQLDSKISEILDGVRHEKPGYIIYVSMIHNAISKAHNSVSGLDVENDSHWLQVVDAVKILHNTMGVLKFGASLLDAKLASICQCVVVGTNVGDWESFSRVSQHIRNSKMLSILKSIGTDLRRIATPGSIYDESYYSFLGTTGMSKMSQIIRLLNNEY